MEISTNEFANEAIKAINSRIRNLKHLNIAVVGKTGVGKSTLINSVFRDNLAETGIGKPITQQMRKISKSDFPLSIYDTPGFELGREEQQQVKGELLEVIKNGFLSKDINNMIHCVWYCINTASSRIEPEEIAWLREFTAENQLTQVPVIIVLTQACPKKKAKEMKAIIESENLDIVRVVPVLSQDMNFDDEFLFKSYGLDTLIEVMSQTLPDELSTTLQNVQIASLESKKKYAQAAVATAVTLAAAECTIPIPCADAVALVPTQITMIASITAIFGVDISKSIITGFVSSTLGSTGATILGKTVVANLFKLLPVAGSFVGGAISASTAGMITAALGESYIQLMIKVYNGEISKNQLETSEGQEELRAIFKSELKKERKNISKQEKINV